MKLNRNLKKPIKSNIPLKTPAVVDKFVIKPKSISLRNKTFLIKLLVDMTESRSFTKEALLKKTDLKQKLSFVEKLLIESEYKNSKEIVFLDSLELTNFVHFANVFNSKIKSVEYKFIGPKITPTIIELLKELSAYTTRKNYNQNLIIFNNFLDVYNLYKRKNKNEPSQKLFSLMLNSSYNGKEHIERLKKIIHLRSKN
jgi:hypothetical protein